MVRNYQIQSLRSKGSPLCFPLHPSPILAPPLPWTQVPGLAYLDLLLMPTLTYPSHPGMSCPSRHLACRLTHMNALLQPPWTGITQAHAQIPLDPHFALVLPLSIFTLQKHVPTCLSISLTQSSRRSELREAQKSSTHPTQFRCLIAQMGKQRQRVQWKQTSWAGGGVAKSQGGIGVKAGFP